MRHRVDDAAGRAQPMLTLPGSPCGTIRATLGV